VFITQTLVIEHANGQITKSEETHGQCDARPNPMVTFLAAQYHRPLTTGTKLYTAWWTEAHLCERIAHGCYLALQWAGVKRVTT